MALISSQKLEKLLNYLGLTPPQLELITMWCSDIGLLRNYLPYCMSDCVSKGSCGLPEVGLAARDTR